MINPIVVDGQVHGGVAQGVGAALLEELNYDRTGQLLTGSLADYAVPTAVEVPRMHVAHLETELPANPGGFRGMGEGGTIGAPAAIGQRHQRRAGAAGHRYRRTAGDAGTHVPPRRRGAEKFTNGELTWKWG